MDLVYKKGDEVVVGYPHADVGYCGIDFMTTRGIIEDIDFNDAYSQPYTITLEGSYVGSFSSDCIICKTKDFNIAKLEEFLNKLYEKKINEQKKRIAEEKAFLKDIQKGQKIFLEHSHQICETLYTDKDVFYQTNLINYKKFE